MIKTCLNSQCWFLGMMRRRCWRGRLSPGQAVAGRAPQLGRAWRAREGAGQRPVRRTKHFGPPIWRWRRLTPALVLDTRGRRRTGRRATGCNRRWLLPGSHSSRTQCCKPPRRTPHDSASSDRSETKPMCRNPANLIPVSFFFQITKFGACKS